MVDQPRSPEDGYHLTEDITDKALEFIKDAKAIVPEKPFFLYYAPGACHAPHHAPKEWSDKFKGRFDMGYEAMREQTLARQKELGLVPADTELPPVNPIGTPDTRTGPDGEPFPPLDYTRPWASLNDDEKRLFCADGGGVRGVPRARRSSHRSAARLLGGERRARQHHRRRRLRQRRERRGRPDGSVNEMKFANGVAEDLAENLAKLDVLGTPATYNHYTNGWAMAFNTPFKMWKRYEFNGGTCDPCIISWPAGSKARGELREQYHHAIDIVADAARPARCRGARDDQGPHADAVRRGQHARQSRGRNSAPSARRTQFYSMLGSRAIWHEGWKAVTTHPTLAGWGHFNDDEWELYNTDIDRPRCTTSRPSTPTRCASS